MIKFRSYLNSFLFKSQDNNHKQFDVDTLYIDLNI